MAPASAWAGPCSVGNQAARHAPRSSSACASSNHTSYTHHVGSIRSSAPADEPLSKTPCRIALLGLPAKLGKMTADALILVLCRDALMCAANFNRPDSRPPPPFSTALNSWRIARLFELGVLPEPE